jgi:predicted metalloprotease with PDZ domain
MKARISSALFLSSTLFGAASVADVNRYEASYRAALRPDAGVIEIELKLTGERLPSRIVLTIDPQRHREFSSTDLLQIEGNEATWRPRGRFSRLRYQFIVNHERSDGGYDSYMTKNWTVFRGDKMTPRVRVTARRGLESRATLEFTAPKGWSVITPYAPVGDHRYEFDDPERRLDRPEGWMLAGRIGTRGEMIGSVQTIVAAPSGDGARRQDMLAFLNWNLPRLLEVFPGFPGRVLIVSAGDPMWRGGLSGPASMFLHADRPLISENRTSTLLHELAHVGMGIRADEESDWIVEGLAEYYSIEALRRSGGISERRHAEALASLEKWAKHAPTLFGARSNGPITARAVLTFRQADAELRAVTHGKKSLDDVARRLAGARGEVTLARLQKIGQEIAGRPLRTFERDQLMKTELTLPERSQ